MTASYALEKATWRDLNALRFLENTCFPQDAWTWLDLIAVLTLPDVIRIKAVAEGNMVGFIAGDPQPEKNFSWIATIGVLPAWRGRGIGRALMLACEEKLTTPLIRLTVRQTNRAAIHLYQSLGYETRMLWRNYYKDKTNALVMEKINPNAL